MQEQWADILRYVSAPRIDDRYTPEVVYVEVAPEVLYRKGRDHLVWRLRNPRLPDGPLMERYERAKRLDVKVWDRLALAEGQSPDTLEPTFRVVRYTALETIREWFTEFLFRALDCGPEVPGGPVKRSLTINIFPKDVRYKL